jgi:DNA ligase-1
MLAHKYRPEKHRIGGWYVSEKLDGNRAFWDGGVTRGMWKDGVPWANTEKDDRYVSRQKSTGLWSRLGNVIHAPDWWLDELPRILLDGELWIGRGIPNRQLLSSTIKKLKPDDEAWGHVRYWVFDSPPPANIFKPGIIDLTHFKTELDISLVRWFLRAAEKSQLFIPASSHSFANVYTNLPEQLDRSASASLLTQISLPRDNEEAHERVIEILDKVTDQGAEGVVLRQPNSWWTPERSHSLLKIKKLHDAEGIVKGYTTGRKTDLGSKLLGLMGALVLDFRGQRLELSGFTDDERALCELEGKRVKLRAACRWACDHPGEEAPDWITNQNFPRGSVVTFRYRELSRDGIPQEARYWRKRED